MNSCCENEEGKKKFQVDWVLHGSSLVILIVLALYLLNYLTGFSLPYVNEIGGGIAELLLQMWWGVALGFIAVGLMGNVPKEYYTRLLGRGDSAGGIFRAAIAGLLLDLCSHGILMVGVRLYERGASLAQVMTFLIASPWNSLSLTLILFALIGVKWTLLFIAGSMIIAIISGFIFRSLVARGVLPDNPHREELSEDFDLLGDAKERLKAFRPDKEFFREFAVNSWTGGRMVLRWLLFGVVLAALIRAFVPTEIFQDWFGPGIAGLFLTLVATTIIEVCSEGSAPIAADLLNRALAPGNAFVFLMAGVATDYTEILVLRDTTRSWKIAFFLPLVTVPQVLVLGFLMNAFA
jgi:hypothetical protein